MDKNLHIVSFDVPYPANYGGVIDVFFKIKTLSSLGVSIHLHCFDYGRNEQKELLKYCSSVKYYTRKSGLYYLLHYQPYIVSTRANHNLLNQLLKDDYPVLLEGLHLGWYIKQLKINNKKVFLRAHNVEHNYYNQLGNVEHNRLKKIFYKLEASKLKNFEKVINNCYEIFSVSENDNNYFKKNYKKATLVSPFHSNDKVKSLEGLGSYALYHGNLSVVENVKAVEFLIDNVFENLDCELFIAGRNPSNTLREKISQFKNIKLFENPSEKELFNLIQNAQVNVLPTFQATGLKLKLVAALFAGRHCLVNNSMIAGSGVNKSIVLCNNANEWKTNLLKLMIEPFDKEMISLRAKDVLHFSNKKNAIKLIETIFG
ncbi:MAG: glycosyltransferase [Flavobacteriales bacterium]|nr:glycosyltransferase [Flavobacteriales bacterium]